VAAPVAAPVSASAVPAVKVDAPILQVGIPVERSLTPGGQDEISLDLAAGFYLRLALDGRGTELNASLLGPGGEVVAKDESDLEGRLAWITAAKGTYQLTVTAPKAKVPCRYQALLLQHRLAIRPDDDKRLTAEAALFTARQEKDAAKAVQQAQAALKLWRELRDSDGEFEALDVIKASDEENAISWYQRALEQAQATGNLSHQARARTDLGEALTRQGRLDEGSSHLEAVLPLWKGLGDAYQHSRALYYLGYRSAIGGNYDRAINLYQEALKSADPTWDITPDLWNGLGAVYSNRGENHEALECFERALRFATDMNRKGAKAVALASLGHLHWRRGEPRPALNELEQSLELNQSDPNLRSYTPMVQLQLGTADLGLGQPHEALENFQGALRAFQQSGNGTWTSIALVSIGRVNLMMGQPTEALDKFQEAWKIASGAKNPKQKGIALQWIGVAQLQLRQVPQAIQSLSEALQIQTGIDRPGQALTEQELGEAYQEQGNLMAARDSLLKALQITEEVEASYSRPPILFDLARLERQQGDLQGALYRIEEAINILETVRSSLTDDRLRTSFFASRRAYYDFFVELLMDLDRQSPGQGYTDRAFDASEKGRARSLLDLLAKGRSELTRGISPDLRQREGEVEARLSQIRQDLVEARSDTKKAGLITSLEEQLKFFSGEQQEVEQRIKAEYPLYAQIRYPSPLQREEIQKLLQPDEALLEYSVGEDAAYLFVVTTDGLAVHPLKTASAKLSEEVGTVRAGLESGGRLTNAYLRTANRLYQELVAPAQAELRSKRRLLIAPDGFLHHLAFEALLTREAQRETDCHFLIEDWAISYIPSASVLSSLRSLTAGAEPRKRLIAFAPSYDPAGSQEQAARNTDPQPVRDASQNSLLPDLEGAREEVAAITHLYPETERAVYVGAEASRENFKRSPRAAFLHFAGHGVLDEEHPERSSLVFSDGGLQVDDIFNLELSSDLVVLSACRTAGKVVTGEGLVGLTRAFLYAGIPSVVVTLWQAVDTSARDLMVQFYGSLGQSEDKAEALRQAKLTMIGRGRQTEKRLIRPYYWAPFILVGKSR
jgi:CHAT domain-containing protein/Tfp pilus assembly protein PilF